MASETRQCQNCRNSFAIEPDDFSFYEKIGVPPPTFCPECRMQRKFAFRNERTLYRDACDLCKKQIISMYSPDKPFTVYCRECWYGDGWDPLKFGREYDWNRPFFLQFREMQERVPRIALFSIRSEIGIDYANFIIGCRNVYLSYSIVNSESVYYSRSIDWSKESFDSLNCRELEMCYGNVDGARNYKSHHLVRSRDCIESRFLFDCVNCQNCFMSTNLRNRQFVFRDKQYSKEEYQRKIREINFGSNRVLNEIRKECFELMSRALHKYANIVKTTNSTGNNIENCKNVRQCFDAYDAEDIKYSNRVTKGSKDVYDNIGVASELLYEGIAGGFGSYGNNFFSFLEASQNIQYSDWCQNSASLFGCISLRKKQYCILNKQYAKEEYEPFVSKIIEHMNTMPYISKVTNDKGQITRGTSYKYGEFFPTEFSPFAYNESLANEYFPLTKEEVEHEGYVWRDPDPYPHQATLQVNAIPDHIREVSNSILNEIIACGSCKRSYRIIKSELEFLRRENLAIPRICQDCRYEERFNRRNPLKLWHRQCLCDYSIYPNTAKHSHHPEGRCPNEFETSYALERPEVVYCEQCYQAEVV